MVFHSNELQQGHHTKVLSSEWRRVSKLKTLQRQCMHHPNKLNRYATTPLTQNAKRGRQPESGHQHKVCSRYSGREFLRFLP